MTFGIKLHRIKINDGTTLSVEPNEILIVTGSNNSGKSQLLRDIGNRLCLETYKPVVSTELSIDYSQTVIELQSTLEEFADSDGYVHLDDPIFTNRYASIARITIAIPAKKPVTEGAPIYNALFSFLRNDTRLTDSNKKDLPNLREKPPLGGLPSLFNRVENELALDKIFYDAFKTNLIVDRGGGREIEFRVGDRSEGESRGGLFSKEHIKWLGTLQALRDQGDGMRAFAGILCTTLTAPRSLVMIDEPESFLHPPHVRKMAGLIAHHIDPSCQIILSTHSDELIKGLLDAAPERVRVLRFQRIETTSKGKDKSERQEINRASQLDPPKVRDLWKDALLRTSDVISALFHEVAIIVEGEVDARFYRALLDAMIEHDRKKFESNVSKRWSVPDLRFYYGTGKGSISKIARQLRAIQVPVLAVTDIDVLENESEFASILEAFGARFGDSKGDWKILNGLMRLERPVNSIAYIEALVQKTLSESDDRTAALSKVQRSTIIEAVRASTVWSGLRKSGERWFAEQMIGATSERHTKLNVAEQAFQRVLKNCEEAGLHILRNGAVESHSPRDGSKSGWLENVLKRDLANDPELEDARIFIRNLVAASEIAIRR